MKQIGLGLPLLLLSACSPASDVPAKNSFAQQAEPSISQSARFDWITTDETVMQTGDRFEFSNVVASLLSDSDDPSSGPTLYDAWTGVGYSWLYPDDVSASPLNDMLRPSYKNLDWSKAALIRMAVGAGIPALAEASTMERPWRLIVRADTKWVDTVVLEPVGDCYRAAGKRCEDPNGESFQFIEALKASEGKVARIECPSISLSAMQSLEIYELTMPGKKPQPIWVYSTGGSSGSVHSEFGIDYRKAKSGEQLCGAIANPYQ